MTIAFLVLGFICLTAFLVMRDRNATPAAAVVKTFVSLFFIATALAAFIQNQSGVPNAPLLPACCVIMGLVLGLVGDILLDLKIVYRQNPTHSDTYTWAGMAVFGMGHVLYIAAVSILYGFNWPAMWAGVILNAIIFLISRLAMKMDFGKWFVPSLLYGFLLSIFMCMVIAVWATTSPAGSDLTLLLAGSVLFLLSDLVLSMTYFQNKDSKAMIAVNHLLYYMAQYAIAVSLKYI